MASLTTFSNLLTLSVNNTTVVYDFDTKLTKKFVTTRDDSSIEPTNVICSSFSDCGHYFVICRKKKLCVYIVKNWSLLIEKILPKTASQVKFMPGSDGILVADKTGDVYFFKITGGDESGKLLLGHLSLILDILVTPGGKYVATCDRDEKIRISCYPNSYNIHGYCLGHEEFVSCIHMLPHNPMYLVSCSGDGTLRVWDYLKCSEILKHSCSRDVDTQSDGGAITQAVICKLTPNSSILVALMAKFSGALVYVIDSEIQDFKCTLRQVILTHAVPWKLACSSSRLCLLLGDANKFLAFYNWSGNDGFVSSPDGEVVLSQFFTSDINKQLGHIFSSEHQVCQLYKRKFDNMKEYLDKKRARLGVKTDTSV